VNAAGDGAKAAAEPTIRAATAAANVISDLLCVGREVWVVCVVASRWLGEEDLGQLQLLREILYQNDDNIRT
jgi:hypothetical protein